MPKRRVKRFNENELRAAVQDHVDKTHQMKSIASNLRGMIGKLAMSADEEGENGELMGPPPEDFGDGISSWNPPGFVQPRATRVPISDCKTESFSSIPRRGHKSRLVPTVFSAPDDLLSDSSDEAIGEASSSDATSSICSSASAADPDGFDAERWHGRVMELLTSLHANDEVEAMQALQMDFASRSAQRSLDESMLEDAAAEGLEELTEVVKAGDSIGDILEENQLALLGRIGGFADALKEKMDEIRERRHQEVLRKEKAARQFTFAGMKAYRPIRKDETSKTPEPSDPPSPQSRKRKTMRGPAMLAQELLKSISTQQTQIAAMEAKTVILRKRLDAHQSTAKHLEACKNDKVGAPTDDVKEVLQQCMTRWAIRSRADSTSTQVVEAELAKEEAAILSELEAEVEMLKQRSRELQESIAPAPAAGAGDRRPSFARTLGTASPSKGDRAKAGGSKATVSRRGSRVGSTEGEFAEAKSTTRSDASRRKAETEEAGVKARMDQAEKELSALEAKTSELDKERQLFMSSLARSHRVGRQPNVASRAGLAAAAAAVAAAMANDTANGSSAQAADDSDSDGEPHARRLEPGKERSGALLAPPSLGASRRSALEEVAERKAGEEADAQQSEWVARQSRLAAACGGDAPADVAEGEKVLARQQRQIAELQERLREAMEAHSVRRAQKSFSAPGTPRSTVAATLALEPAAEGGAEAVEATAASLQGGTPLSLGVAPSMPAAAETAAAADGEAGPAAAATGRVAADSLEPVGPTNVAVAAGAAGAPGVGATEGAAEPAGVAAAGVAAAGVSAGAVAAAAVAATVGQSEGDGSVPVGGRGESATNSQTQAAGPAMAAGQAEEAGAVVADDPSQAAPAEEGSPRHPGTSTEGLARGGTGAAPADGPAAPADGAASAPLAAAGVAGGSAAAVAAAAAGVPAAVGRPATAPAEDAAVGAPVNAAAAYSAAVETAAGGAAAAYAATPGAQAADALAPAAPTIPAIARRRSRSAGSAGSCGEGVEADPQQLMERLERAKGEERRLSKELVETDELLRLVEGKDHLEPEEAEKVCLALQRRMSEASQHAPMGDQVEALRRQVASLRRAVEAKQRKEHRGSSAHSSRGGSGDHAHRSSGSKSAPRAREEPEERKGSSVLPGQGSSVDHARRGSGSKGIAEAKEDPEVGAARLRDSVRQTFLELQAQAPSRRRNSRVVPRGNLARGTGQSSMANLQDLGVIAHRIDAVARPSARSLRSASTIQPQEIFDRVKGSLRQESIGEGQ